MSGVADVEAEFREFVSARSTALLRTAYLLAGDWATAEDLVQISLTKTYLAWKRLGHLDAVDAYARRVLVNTATSWWRRRWHRERPTDVVPELPAEDSSQVHVERQALWQHVKALPPRQRAVLVLRFYEDMSEVDTAAALGVTVGTVKSQCFRALATLRGRIGDPDAPLPEPTGPPGAAPAGGDTGQPGPGTGTAGGGAAAAARAAGAGAAAGGDAAGGAGAAGGGAGGTGTAGRGAGGGGAGGAAGDAGVRGHGDRAGGAGTRDDAGAIARGGEGGAA